MGGVTFSRWLVWPLRVWTGIQAVNVGALILFPAHWHGHLAWGLAVLAVLIVECFLFKPAPTPKPAAPKALETVPVIEPVDETDTFCTCPKCGLLGNHLIVRTTEPAPLRRVVTHGGEAIEIGTWAQGVRMTYRKCWMCSHEWGGRHDPPLGRVLQRAPPARGLRPAVHRPDAGAAGRGPRPGDTPLATGPLGVQRGQGPAGWLG